MRHSRLSLLMAVALLSACSENESFVKKALPIEPSDADAAVVANDDERPERRSPKSFFALTDQQLWRYGARSDTVFSVGIRTPGRGRGFNKGRWEISPTDLGAKRLAASQLSRDIQVVGADSILPRLFIKVSSPAGIRALRKLPYVDYVEPRSFPSELVAVQSVGGCSKDYSGNLWQPDVTGDQLPKSFIKSNIHRAWAYASGRGKTLAILDSGIDPQNTQLTQAAFSAGFSANRSITHVKSGSFNYGDCPHGTYMAGVAVAPRNGTGTQGVAWGASLRSIGVNDGVANAFGHDIASGVLDAMNANVDVIVMALGLVLESSVLNDMILHAYYARGIVVVAAAGTTPPWSGLHNIVVFPARIREVLGVSAATFDGSRDPASHYGAGLDITAFSPTTTLSYDGRSTHDFGNSSNGSAIVSGVALLVRERFPSISADSVIKRLINTSGSRCGVQFAFHPAVNAEAAVGGLCVPNGAPAGLTSFTFDKRAYGDNRSSVTSTYCLNASGGIGPREVTWTDGSHGTCRQVTFERGNYTTRVVVSVRDTGVSLPAATYVLDVKVEDRDTSPDCPTCF